MFILILERGILQEKVAFSMFVKYTAGTLISEFNIIMWSSMSIEKRLQIRRVRFGSSIQLCWWQTFILYTFCVVPNTSRGSNCKNMSKWTEPNDWYPMICAVQEWPPHKKGTLQALLFYFLCDTRTELNDWWMAVLSIEVKKWNVSFLNSDFFLSQSTFFSSLSFFSCEGKLSFVFVF